MKIPRINYVTLWTKCIYYPVVECGPLTGRAVILFLLSSWGLKTIEFILSKWGLQKKCNWLFIIFLWITAYHFLNQLLWLNTSIFLRAGKKVKKNVEFIVSSAVFLSFLTTVNLLPFCVCGLLLFSAMADNMLTASHIFSFYEWSQFWYFRN